MKKHSFLGVSDEGFHNVAYTEWGSSDLELPTVICVHGYTRNSRDFDSLAYYLVLKVDPGINNPKSTLQVVSEFFHHPHKSLEGILYDIDLWSIWQQIKCPVLVIHGIQSDLLTSEIIKKMKRTHDKTEVYEIEDAGHAPALLNTIDHQTIEQWLNSN